MVIKNKKLNPIKIINTHCHIDHILGNQFVHKTWKIDLHIHIIIYSIHKVYNDKVYKHIGAICYLLLGMA